MTDRIRYGRLGYVHLCVTDIEASRQFYESGMGLQVSEATANEVRVRCSDKPHDLILQKSVNPGLKRIGFEMEDAANLQILYSRAAELALSPRWATAEECKTLKVAQALRFLNPNTKLEFEFYAGQEKSGAPFAPTNTKIARLGHVGLNVVDFDAEFDFWVSKLGFALSDTASGYAAFLRCFPNPLHHTLTLVKGKENALNHVNFMVTDIDDVGRAIYRMRKIGAPIVFGPGRHKPSESIFLYFLDPDGMTMEYSFGMELFDEFNARPPRELERSAETLDMWGGLPSAEFGKFGPILSSHG